MVGKIIDVSTKQQSTLPDVEDCLKFRDQKIMGLEGLLGCFVGK